MVCVLEQREPKPAPWHKTQIFPFYQFNIPEPLVRIHFAREKPGFHHEFFIPQAPDSSPSG
jgi:hypothetical protein